MTLDRDTVLAGLDTELVAFGDLVASLEADDLAQPTRCKGWTVSDVAGHVIGTVVDVTVGNLDGQGSPAVTGRQASERRGRTSADLAAELAAARPTLASLLESLPTAAWDGPSMTDPAYTLGFAIEALWYDAYVHGDDIRAATGRPSVRSDGLRCAVHHIAGYLEHRGWTRMTLALEGLGPVHIGGGGPVAAGDPLDFVLAATGRLDPSTVGLDPAINVYAPSAASNTERTA